MELRIGSPVSLGHYRILRRLRFGGMSEIYLACDERDQREVALKVVDMALDDLVKRFRGEVEVLRLLNHEHILPIFDAGEQDGWSYFAMPYLRQGSLRERLKHGPLTLEEAGDIFEQVADALDYAHGQGVLHRDIKPSNILFRNEQFVYLADFGLAKLVEQEGSITQTGCLIGTPHYVAPELANEDASPKSDQYALGILLYKMLTGKVPFQGGNAITICWKHMYEQPQPPSSLNPAIPPAINQLILQALEKDPAHRFSSVQQMAKAYRQAMQELQQPKMTAGHYFTLKPPRTPVQVEHLQSRRRFPPNSFSRAATAGALLMLFCIAPLYLGFSLYRANMEPAQLSAHVQAASTFLEAQPFLPKGNHPVSGQAQAVSLALSAELSSSSLSSLPSQQPSSQQLPTQQLPASGSNQPSGGSNKGNTVLGLTQSQENEETGNVHIQSQEKKSKGEGKGQVRLHVQGSGKPHLHEGVGKHAGHGGHKNKKRKKA